MKQFFTIIFILIIFGLLVGILKDYSNKHYIATHPYEKSIYGEKCTTRTEANGNIRYPVYYRDFLCKNK